MRSLWLALLGLGLCHAARAQEACVSPTADVTSAVLVRESATLDSPVIDRIPSQGQARLLGQVPAWFLVRTASGKRGFASLHWMQPVACPMEDTSDTSYTLDAVDVGTGVALLIRGPDFTVLYDGGSNDDIAKGDKNRLLAYLQEAAPDLQVIDHVILSHPHRDHVELLADVLGGYHVDNLWSSGAFNAICGFRALLVKAAESGVRYHTATANYGHTQVNFAAGCGRGQEQLTVDAGARIASDPIALGAGASMRFLYADGETHSDLNDNSLVVRFDLGNRTLLLVGDAGAGSRADPSADMAEDSIESVLLDCCRQMLASDVLVVGHHGSKTSSRATFLDAVGATDYIVSSGPFKYSGVQLPDQVVIDELTQHGRIWRTDVDDDACKQATDKVGPDADGKAGGCSNVRMTFTDAGIQTRYVER